MLPPAVARHGDETNNVRIGVEGGMVEQMFDMDAVPALGAVKATRAMRHVQ